MQLQHRAAPRRRWRRWRRSAASSSIRWSCSVPSAWTFSVNPWCVHGVIVLARVGERTESCRVCGGIVTMARHECGRMQEREQRDEFGRWACRVDRRSHPARTLHRGRRANTSSASAVSRAASTRRRHTAPSAGGVCTPTGEQAKSRISSTSGSGAASSDSTGGRSVLARAGTMPPPTASRPHRQEAPWSHQVVPRHPSATWSMTRRHARCEHARIALLRRRHATHARQCRLRLWPHRGACASGWTGMRVGVEPAVPRRRRRRTTATAT
jgi:hypothetical protein